MRKKKKGITLVVLVIIIVLLAIIVGGITSYISEGLRLDIVRQSQAKAFYLAQAGIVRAIADYRNSPSGLWDKIANTNISDEFYYQAGEDANFLWVDATSPIASGRILNNIPIKNINATGPITITELVVTWTFGGRIREVFLGGTRVYGGAAQASPANLDIEDFTITSGAGYNAANDQAFRFNTNIPIASSVAVDFIFSDGSAFKTSLLKDGQGANKEFSLKATGSIPPGPGFTAKRTILSTYDTGTGNVTSWEETEEHLP